jgi:putative transposase
MRQSRFKEEQIIAILREQESGIATAEVCRKHGISSAISSCADARLDARAPPNHPYRPEIISPKAVKLPNHPTSTLENSSHHSIMFANIN